MHKVSVIFGQAGFNTVTEQFGSGPVRLINTGNSKQDSRFTKNVVRKLTHNTQYAMKQVGQNLEFVEVPPTYDPTNYVKFSDPVLPRVENVFSDMEQI